MNHEDEREGEGMGGSDGPPVTGDRAVDRIISDLESQLRGEGADAVAALTEAHRRLQSRLSDPGPTPPSG